MDIREEFEKLEAIDRMMQLCGATYSEITRNYKIKSTGLYDVEVCSFINGAWYTFQEQQKKIDDVFLDNAKLKHVIDQVKLHNGSLGFRSMQRMIEELLK